jgi:hypothetical protein
MEKASTILFVVRMGCAATQTATGLIAGVVRDGSDAAIPAAQAKLESRSTLATLNGASIEDRSSLAC